MFYNQNFYDYTDRLDKYNYVNNNYNQPMYKEDANPSTILDPYQGLIKGNMFKNLYNGYDFKNLDITPLNEQAKMLTTLDSLDFASLDIKLYLDVNPNDKDMINLYNNYIKEANELRKQYELKYGPILCDSEVMNKYPWVWNNSPWPWERGGN